ncbi:MAG: hypothetical protein J6C37_00350, partial [Roseburia sp.]|nr:hypothetical protein [Roseburia sp.]
MNKLQRQQYGVLTSRNTQNMSNRLLKMTEQEKYSAYYMLREQLNAILLTDSSLEDVVIYFPDLKLQYSANNGKKEVEKDNDTYWEANIGINYREKEIFFKSIYPIYGNKIAEESQYAPLIIVTKMESKDFLDILEMNDGYENVS